MPFSYSLKNEVSSRKDPCVIRRVSEQFSEEGMDVEGCNIWCRLTHGWIYDLLALLGGAGTSDVGVGWRKWVTRLVP